MPASACYLRVNQRIAQRIADRKLVVPILPEVAGRALRLAQDPDSDAAALANLIQSDQTLAGHVMRVANSAAYSPSSSIVSLQQAISRLGMKHISEIALAASINSSLFDAPGFEAHIAYIMKYSLATGLWAKEVARTCRKNVEAAFLAGLLHDIGRPVAVQAAVAAARELGQRLGKDEVLQLEQDFQRQISTEVVSIWEMPSAVCNVVSFFDHYQEAHNNPFQTMVVVAGALVAGHFMCEAAGGGDCIALPELLADPVFAELNLYPDDVQALLAKHDAVNSALEALCA